MDRQKALSAIAELRGQNSSRKMKYTRNYRRYYYTPFCNLDSIKNPEIVGYYQQDFSDQSDLTQTPELNVIRSCVDTLVSKIAQSKVRPYFNCVNGTFKDIQIVKQAQQYFDIFFDQINANDVVSNAFKDACIFDTGYIFIDPIEKTVRRALPWQVFMRASEVCYGKITRVYYEQKEYPVTLLPIEFAEKADRVEFVTYGLYFDTFNKIQAVYIPELQILDVKPYNAGVIPFVSLYYSKPVKGGTSTSIVDMLNSIQIEIDQLMARVKDASLLNPAMTFFLPQGSGIKVQQLNNGVGNIVEYKPTPNMTQSPVTTSTPAFISEQYMMTIQQLKQDAYEMVGISQLSAQSQKPTGLNSGVALQTMENIESDRFETQLNQIIRAYVDIAKTCIAVFDKNENILPEANNRIRIKWGDIVAQSEKMTIQFSGADSLSKDPSTKLDQLQKLAQAGVIPLTRVAQFMEIPDLQGGYSLSNNAVNAVMSVINSCLEKNEIDVPDYVPFQMLKEEIINTQLSLRGANYDRNKDDIAKLQRLYEVCEDKEKEWQTAIQNMQNAVAEQQNENALPQQQNVLTQEANMQQTPTPQGMANADLDMDTQQNNAGAWNN